MKNPLGSPPTRLSTVLAAVLAVWAAIALGDAFHDTWRRQSRELFHEWEVQAWTPGSPPQHRLEWFLRSVEADVPPGASVLFTSAIDDEPGAAEGSLYLYFWSAYLWPDRELRRWRGPSTLDDVDYWVSYREPIRHDRAHEVRSEPLGHLYRVVP